ncbi:MAG: IS66 family transposase, partial [Spirochaetaceae bacterium]|nr:IS66 family transposase [Spirochaetaceae bacterium]
MKDGKPETLEEAIALIVQQQNRLSELENKVSEQNRKLINQHNAILVQKKLIAEQTIEIKILNEKLAHRKAMEYAARSEKISRLLKDQPFLFDSEELGISVENPCPSPSDEEISQSEESEEELADIKAKKSNKGRKSLSTINKLAKKRIVIDLTDEEKICPNCGTQMRKVNTVESERIVHVPAYEYIEVVVRNVYECPECVTDDDKPVRKTAKEKRIIERSIATPSLLSHVFTGKYMRHTPFYCQEDCYNYQGLHISRQDMCNWQQKVFDRLRPLKELLDRELKKGKFLMFDETPLEVLKYREAEAGKEYWEDKSYRKKESEDGKESQCYMWLVRGGAEHPVHSYNFRWTRSGRNVISFLEGFSGSVIQSDGYSGYDSAVAFWNENHPDHKITLCNCNIHARRKFADSVKATKSKTAEQAVRSYGKIFKAEKELREKFQKNLITEEKYLEQRKEKVLPLFENFHDWLLEKDEREEIVGSSKTAEAIKYCLKNWNKLIRFL